MTSASAQLELEKRPWLQPFTAETARQAASKPRVRIAAVRVIGEFAKLRTQHRADTGRRWTLDVAKTLMECALDRESPHYWRALELFLQLDPEARDILSQDAKDVAAASAPRIVIVGPNSAAPVGDCIDVQATQVLSPSTELASDNAILRSTEHEQAHALDVHTSAVAARAKDVANDEARELREQVAALTALVGQLVARQSAEQSEPALGPMPVDRSIVTTTASSSELLTGSSAVAHAVAEPLVASPLPVEPLAAHEPLPAPPPALEPPPTVTVLDRNAEQLRLLREYAAKRASEPDAKRA